MKKLIIRTIGIFLTVLAEIAPQTSGKIIFKLFSHPVRFTLRKKQKDFLNSAASCTVDFNGIKLQVYQWGHGTRNILFIHGWQSNTYFWKPYVESFDKNEYTLHAFDAPGHGFSTGNFLSAPLYREAILNIVKSIGSVDCVISHSFGSFSALYTLYSKPELPVKKIVVMASPAEAQEFIAYNKQYLRLSEKCVRLLVEQFEVAFKHLPSYFSASTFVSSLTLPGLIIHDEEDQETPFMNAEKIHNAWKNSQLLITNGFGHNLRSFEVLRDVIEFASQPHIHEPARNISVL